MVILDIDLDFFLKDIVHNPKQERPDDSDYAVWQVDKVLKMKNINVWTLKVPFLFLEDLLSLKFQIF